MSIVFNYQTIYKWQEPNSTEKNVFENLLKYFVKKTITDHIEYYAYPWANIIEYAQIEKIELSKFINVIMECGKKAVAEKIVYNALEISNKSFPERKKNFLCFGKIKLTLF